MEIYSAAQMVIVAVVAGAAGGIAGAWFVIRSVSIVIAIARKEPKPSIDAEFIRNWCAECGMPQPLSSEIDELIAAIKAAA